MTRNASFSATFKVFESRTCMYVCNLFPGDFVTNVKQINSQSDLISISSFAARLTSQSDPLSARF